MKTALLSTKWMFTCSLGCETLLKAFEKFTAPEILDKANKYKCPR